MRVDWATHTDTGNVREQNEDSALIRPDAGFGVLADGMGGHQAGEVASRLAVETYEKNVTAPADSLPSTRIRAAAPFEVVPLIRAAWAANEAVHAEASANPDRQGMGCTLVALHLNRGLATYVTIGDSRLYLLRAGRLIQVSEDHTRQRMLERSGIRLDPVEANQIKGILMRALGTQPAIEVDYGAGYSIEGDVWLFCSDGLTDELDDEAIRSILSSAGDATQAAMECVNSAVAAGGRDNVTVIVARVLSSSAETAEDPAPMVTFASQGLSDSDSGKSEGIFKRISRKLLGEGED